MNPEEQEENRITLQLNEIDNEIHKLDHEVRRFPGPHFTKEYRLLQNQFGKLEVELDSLQVGASATGREYLRERRRRAINEIEGLARTLESKTHPEGKSCTLCEVKEG